MSSKHLNQCNTYSMKYHTSFSKFIEGDKTTYITHKKFRYLRESKPVSLFHMFLPLILLDIVGMRVNQLNISKIDRISSVYNLRVRTHDTRHYRLLPWL